MSFLAPDDPMFDTTYGDAVDRLNADPDEWPCARCGQLAAVDPATPCSDAHVCDACRGLERAPQGEAMQLFAPVAAPMPGQLELG